MLTRARLWDLLRRAQGVARIERRLRDLEERLDARFAAVEGRLGSPDARADPRVDALALDVAAVRDQLGRTVVPVLRAIASEDAENRRRLWSLRESAEYEIPFQEPEPLVSVVIPTRNRPELLCERSLPSVLSQTHARLEVIVIGDHAPDEIADAVARVGDPRVRWQNLTQRLPPPEDPERAWQVGSVMARNEGFRLARGSWLMSFDDDDRLLPEAVERLLAAARSQRAEVAYGRFRAIWSDRVLEHGHFPPRLGDFGWQSAIRHAGLRFFERELFAAQFDVPNDFFTADAMLRAGVRFTMIDDLVFDYHPARAWGAGA